MKEDFHVDLSIRLYEKGNTGIACVSSKNKKHTGCVLTYRLKQYIKNSLFVGNISEEKAKLYAICIYYLVEDYLEDINTLIICNDEDFTYVKEYLIYLINLNKLNFEIINITEFQKRLGRRVKSLADNYAKIYRKRGLQRNKWHIGKNLNLVELNYEMIKEKWEELNKI